MITENLSTLKIHKLTQAQYDRELAAGNIDETALYLTPYVEPASNGTSDDGVYELIDEITTTDELTSFNRTTWPNGTPYNFKAIYVTIKTATGTASGNFNVRAWCNSTALSNVTVSGGVNTGARYTIFKTYSDHGIWNSNFAMTSGQWGATQQWYIREVPYLQKDYAYINKFEILCATGVTLPVGTIIRIYGVRA